MADATQIVKEYLTDESGSLRTFLGGNYLSTPVAPMGWTNSHKAIIYHEETGTAHITGATLGATFVFKCYGGDDSYTNARAVRDALYDYLHNARGVETASGRLVLAELIVRFQGPPEPETGWPVAMAKYNIVTE